MLINVSPKSLLSAGANIVIVVPTLGLRQPSLSITLLNRTIINFVIFIVITIITIVAITTIVITWSSGRWSGRMCRVCGTSPGNEWLVCRYCTTASRR